MENTKPLSFHTTAGSYFLLTIISIIFVYIPFFGWAFLLNYTSEWFADNSLVHGKKVIYKATYGESLSFVFVNSLLMLITFGIYSFWFYPKIYTYFAEHVSYDEAATVVPVAPVMTTPLNPITEA